MAIVPSTSHPAAAAVDSVFARTGAVVAAAGDYTAAQVGAAGSDGWVTAADTWTYASATTFTIAGADRTAIFTPGTRLKLTQTTAKYFVVVSSAFSTDTTVTLTGGIDYTLANAAITLPFYSYAVSPQGYPGVFAYVPTATGFSSALTVNLARFSMLGRLVTLTFDVSGTSNATTFTLAAPIAANTTNYTTMVCVSIDSGSNNTGRVDSLATPLRFGRTVTTAGGFTASGVKGAAGIFIYEAA